MMVNANSAAVRSRGRAPHGSNGDGPASERVTVNLAPRAVTALEELVRSTGDSKTDSINQALQIYAYIRAHLDAGGTFYLRDQDSNELERLHIL